MNKSKNFLLATEVWERILEKFGILRIEQNPTIVIAQVGSKLDIRIRLHRNSSMRGGRYRSRYYSHNHRISSSSRESILLVGSIFKNGNSIGKTISKRVSIWKDENVPERIVSKRIEELFEEVSLIKQELNSELNKFLIIESKEKEFGDYLKNRYKDCKIEILSPERATLKYVYFDISIGRDEKVSSIYLREPGTTLFIWDLASVMQDIRPLREGRRSSRLFRIDPIQKTKLVSKNEETREGT